MESSENVASEAQTNNTPGFEGTASNQDNNNALNRQSSGGHLL
jgi:hypothetical protein